jgi:hypothetical protein
MKMMQTSLLPEPDFSGSIDSESSVSALEDEKLRLQALVCHLLRENEQLRTRQLESGRVLIHAAVDTTKKEKIR